MVSGVMLADAGAKGKRLRRAAVAALMMTSGLVTAVAAVPAHAQEATRNFDIPAQPLATALTAFGQQSGLQVSAQAPLVEGKTSNAVNGVLPPMRALSQLLAGSGLTFRVVGSTVTLEPAPQTSSDAIQLGPVRVQGASGGGSGSGAWSSASGNPPATVTEDTGSYTTRALTLGKFGESLRETPRSVTVITDQRVKDQNMVSIRDAIRWIPGIEPEQFFAGGQEWFGRGVGTSRGLPLKQLSLDGVNVTLGNGIVATPDLVTFDHVEVRRGPDALFTGTGGGISGGVVALTRKRPTQDRQIKLDLNAGSWGSHRVTLDLSGPLALDGALRARAIVSRASDRSFREGHPERRNDVVYGILEYQPVDSTVFSLGASREWRSTKPYGLYLPLRGDGTIPDYRRSTNLSPDWNNNNLNTTTIFADVTHKFSDVWTLELHALSGNASDVGTRSEAQGGYIDPIGPYEETRQALPTLGYYAWNYRQRHQSLTADLRGAFELFGRRHDLVLGGNFSTGRYSGPTSYSADIASVNPNGWSLPSSNIWDLNFPIDPLNLVRGAIPQPVVPIPDIPGSFSTEEWGVYGQLRLRLLEPLTLIAGGRLSGYKTIDKCLQDDCAEIHKTTDGRDGIFVKNAGLIWDFSKNLSAYASYGDVFQLQQSYDIDRKRLPPITGSNYEAGIKGEFNDGKLNMHVAVFRVRQTNQAVNDYQGPSPCPTLAPGNSQPSRWCSIAGGEFRSDGIDTEISGEVLPGLQIAGGLSLYKSKQYNPSNYNEITGEVLPGAWDDDGSDTTYSYKIYARYQAPSSKWRFGGGAQFHDGFVNERLEAVTPGGVTIPGGRYEQNGYVLIDAFVGYRLSNTWDVQLNAENLLNEKYYNYIGPDGIWFGEPHKLTLAARASF